jgi:23S rRNA (adenine1618-N6)-methyltransferase
MIGESVAYRRNVQWFTTLVSKEKHLAPLIRRLENIGNRVDIRVIEMQHGNKMSRILCWRF